MSPFAFRTAIPFGYLFFYGGLLIVAIIGCGLIVVALKRHKATLAGAGALLTTGVALVVWANIDAESALDMNPLVQMDSSIVGAWHDGAATLELRRDHSYVCAGNACGPLAVSGTWERAATFDLIFRPTAGSPQVRRLMRYRGQLRLTHEF